MELEMHNIDFFVATTTRQFDLNGNGGPDISLFYVGQQSAIIYHSDNLVNAIRSYYVDYLVGFIGSTIENTFQRTTPPAPLLDSWQIRPIEIIEYDEPDPEEDRFYLNIETVLYRRFTGTTQTEEREYYLGYEHHSHPVSTFGEVFLDGVARLFGLETIPPQLEHSMYLTPDGAGIYTMSDGINPDIEIEVRAFEITNLRALDAITNPESPDSATLKIRGDITVYPNPNHTGLPAWTPIEDVQWRVRLQNPDFPDFVYDGTSSVGMPDSNGVVGELSLDIPLQNLPDRLELNFDIKVIAIVSVDNTGATDANGESIAGGNIIARPDIVPVTISRCRCENEEILGGNRSVLPVIIHSSPLGQNLNPSWNNSSSGGCVIPSLASNTGWNSIANSGIVQNTNGGFSYQDESGRTHSWDEDNGDYLPRFPDNRMNFSVDSGSTDKRYTITYPDGTAMHFDDHGRVSSFEDTNGNVTTYTHQSTYFSISDGFDRTTYYHRTSATEPPHTISDHPDPEEISSRRYQMTYYSSGPSDGLLESMTDPEGQTTVYTYNQQGQIIAVRQVRATAGDQVITYDYYESGNPNAGRLKSTTVLGLYKETKEYNEPIETYFGTKTTIEDLTPDNENETREMYQVLDSKGRPIRVYELYSSDPTPQYNVAVMEYNDPPQGPPPSDPNDVQESNDIYLPIKQISPNGAITEYKYTPRGNVKKMIDAQGNITIFKYAEQEPTSNVHTTFPDKLLEVHRSPVTVDGVLQTYPPTKFTYHSTTGNLLSVEDANVIGMNGQLTSFQYNSDGQITEVTNRLGFKTRYEYDPSTGNLLKVGVQKSLDPQDDDINTDFRYLTFTYDAYDNVESVTDDLGNGTFAVYDNLDRLREFTDAVDALHEYDYAEWVLSSMTAPDNSGSDENRRTTTPQYDIAGRLTALYRDIDDLSNQEFRVGYSYDGLSQLTALTRTKLGNPEDFTFSYDRLGRVVESKDPREKASTAAYEPFCVGSATTSARGVRTKTSFDSLCRLTEVLAGAPDATSDMDIERLSESRVFEYDELGRMTESIQKINPLYGKAVFGSSKYGSPLEGEKRTYEYDVLDRLTKIVFEDGKEMLFEYDYEGNLTKMTENASSATPVITECAYYGDNQLHTVALKRAGGDQVFTYSYDAVGRLKSIQYPSSTGMFAFFDDGANPDPAPGWDGNGRLTHLRYVRSGSEIRRYEYTYDKSGNRVTHRDIASGVDAKLWVYKHDWLDRLIEVRLHTDPEPGQLDVDLAELRTVYVYDASDNPISLSFESLPTKELYTYEYDRSDNLVKIDKQVGTDPPALWESFTSDDDGNMLTRVSDGVTTTYSWTEFNRLASIKTSDDSKKQSNTFAVNGFRRKKKDKDGIETTEYSASLSTAVAKNTNETVTYLMGHHLLGFENGGSQNYFLTDGLTTVRDIINSSGSVVASYEFNEYGRRISTFENGVSSLKTYVGGLSVQDEVAETSLMLMGHRFYDPSLGRFLNRDPVGFAGGLNLFSYGANNPVSRVDHTGLFDWGRAAGGFFRGLGLAAVGAAATAGFLTMFPATTVGVAVLGAVAVGTAIGTGLYEAFTGREHRWDGSGAMLDEGDYSESIGNTASIVVGGSGLFQTRSLLSDCPPPLRPPIQGPSPKISPAQFKHIPGHNDYIPGRSILTAEASELGRSTGSGKMVGQTKERINFRQNIGEFIDADGFPTVTTNGMVHYSKKGIHIIPSRPE